MPLFNLWDTVTLSHITKVGINKSESFLKGPVRRILGAVIATQTTEAV